MRVLMTFIGLSFGGAEAIKGGFYVNAVSLDHAHDKAEKILFNAGIEPELLGCCNDLSDEFHELLFLDTFKGLNGIIKCNGKYKDTGETFERGIILKNGSVVGNTDLYESEVQCLKYI